MKLPSAVESEIQALEHEMGRRGRKLRMMQAGPDRFRRLRTAVETALQQPGTCAWTQDQTEASWDTGCGNKFVLTDEGTPRDHQMHFCCYCGATIQVVMA